MKIAIVGSGYVGLVAGACLAENGNDVVCVDKDPAKVRALQRGRIPIYEPGLEEMVRRNRAEKRLTFTTALDRGVRTSQIIFIAVGTPTGEDGSADLQHVLGVARDIAKSMNGYKVIVNKSTVPVGTAVRVRDIVRRETTHPFSVVSNPEFLKQGAAIDDFMKPDRVVIGAEDPRGAELMKELYAPFTRTGAPIMLMDCASAELCKYAANAMLATRISFMNEVSNVCEAVGANVDEVRRAVAADRRIGASFLFPGVGYGGSCFPKDVKAMLQFAGAKAYDFKILQAVESVNDRQKERLLEKLKAHFGDLPGKRVAVWGLAFKPRTDDMREAPAVPLIKGLLAAGVEVHAYDPEAMTVAKGIFGNKVTFADNSYAALTGADALVIVTEWNEFREPDYGRMKKLMRGAVIFDGRNVYNPEQIRAQGFTSYFDGPPVSGVLVTGGAGYIGSHAVQALVAGGERVIIYDNLSAGHAEAARRAGGADATLVNGDILDTGHVQRTIEAHDVGAVMHFAAWLSVGESVRDPSGYYRNNVGGALSVLDAMHAAGARHFVFSSTAAVFGNPEQTPITEDHPTRPINAYGETKLAIERALPHYERAYGIRSVALRYFNAAGADPGGALGEHHDPELHVIPRAIDAAAGRGTFQVFGEDYDTPDGTCLRDYVHVTDLAQAHRLALGALRSGAASTVYNLGNGRPTSVRAILQSIERIGGKAVPYTAGPRRDGDPAVLFASSERIRRELGWAPQYEDVDTIVATAWRWREAHPHGYHKEKQS